MKDALMLAVQITPAERDEIKRIAKSKGMMMSGLLGQLIRNEIRNNQASPSGIPHTLEGIQGTNPSSLDFGR